MATLPDLVERYKRDMLAIAQESIAVTASNVVRRTPVDTGALRASWTPSLNAVRVVNVDTGGSNTRSAIASTVNALRLGDSFWFANGQPYVRRIEYEGHSAQAPGGMLWPTVVEFPAVVARAARGV